MTINLLESCQDRNLEKVNDTLNSEEFNTEDFLLTDGNGNTPLHLACYNGDWQIAGLILEKANALEKKNIKLGWSSDTNVEYLLSIRNRVQGELTSGNYNSKQFAFKHNTDEFAKQFVRYKVKDLPWEILGISGNEKALKIGLVLEEYKKKIVAVMNFNFTTMAYAICNGHLELVKLLIKYGYDIKEIFKNIDGNTSILQFALEKNQYIIAKYLIDQGAEFVFIKKYLYSVEDRYFPLIYMWLDEASLSAGYSTSFKFGRDIFTKYPVLFSFLKFDYTRKEFSLPNIFNNIDPKDQKIAELIEKAINSLILSKEGLTAGFSNLPIVFSRNILVKNYNITLGAQFFSVLLKMRLVDLYKDVPQIPRKNGDKSKLQRQLFEQLAFVNVMLSCIEIFFMIRHKFESDITIKWDSEDIFKKLIGNTIIKGSLAKQVARGQDKWNIIEMNIPKKKEVEDLIKAVEDYANSILLPKAVRENEANENNIEAVQRDLFIDAFQVLFENISLDNVIDFARHWKSEGTQAKLKTAQNFPGVEWTSLFSGLKTGTLRRRPASSSDISGSNNIVLVCLHTANQVIDQGRKLNNCLSGKHIRQCLYENYHLISIQRKDGTILSTVRLLLTDKNKIEVVEHLGNGNGKPCKEAVDALEYFIMNWSSNIDYKKFTTACKKRNLLKGEFSFKEKLLDEYGFDFFDSSYHETVKDIYRSALGDKNGIIANVAIAGNFDKFCGRSQRIVTASDSNQNSLHSKTMKVMEPRVSSDSVAASNIVQFVLRFANKDSITISETKLSITFNDKKYIEKFIQLLSKLNIMDENLSKEVDARTIIVLNPPRILFDSLVQELENKISHTF